MPKPNTFLVSQEYRIYPNRVQREQINKTLGCCRFVYNRSLALANEQYQKWKDDPKLEKPSVSRGTLSRQLTLMKQEPELEWLNEVSSVALQQSTIHLNIAFDRFFKGVSQYPKFKKKPYGGTFTLMQNAFELFTDSIYPKVKIAKTPGFIKLNINPRRLPEDIKSIKVKRNSLGQYFITLVGNSLKPKTEGIKRTGIDLGIKDLFTFSDGTKVNNPKHYINHQRHLRRLQQSLSKKVKGSRNHEKSRLKVAKLHQRIANQRLDILHKMTSKLVNENQVIGIETLMVSNMVRNRRLAKYIADAGWGEFTRQLSYKVRWSQHCELVLMSRWFPSSKLCSNCNVKNDKLKLSIRLWECSECGTLHDRDHNAAQNILKLANEHVFHYGYNPGCITLLTTDVAA